MIIHICEQLLYSRLALCKTIGAQTAAQNHAPLLPNPVAVQLGLDEANGPSAVLAQAMEALGGGGEDCRTVGESCSLQLLIVSELN